MKPRQLKLSKEDSAEFFAVYDNKFDRFMPKGWKYIILQINDIFSYHPYDDKIKLKKQQARKMRNMAKWLNKAANWLEND